MQGLGVVSPRSMAAIATEIAAVLLNEDCRNVLSLHSDRTHVIFYILLNVQMVGITDQTKHIMKIIIELLL